MHVFDFLDALLTSASFRSRVGLHMLDICDAPSKHLPDWAWELLVGLATWMGPLLMLLVLMGLNTYITVKPLLMRIFYGIPHGEAFAEARYDLARFWEYYGKIFHEYEVIGFDNIPAEGGALIAYYHGTMPVDYMLLVGKIFLEKNRIANSVVDKCMYMMPGLKMIGVAFRSFPGSRPECVKRLKQGDLVGVAPGGAYEAQIGSNRYELLWKKRLGFARAAIEAGVPIIPVFTENSREVTVNLQTGLSISEIFFNLTKLPLVPIYGWFPVKLRTHVGQPIYPEEGITPQELRDKTVAAVEQLIRENQTIPGNIFRGIRERMGKSSKDNILDEEKKAAFYSSSEYLNSNSSADTSEAESEGFPEFGDQFTLTKDVDDMLALSKDKDNGDDDDDDDDAKSSGIESMTSSSSQEKLCEDH